MARVRNYYCTSGRVAALVWISSALLFYLAFRAAMQSSIPSDPESSQSSSERRSQLYDKMARDLDEHGAAFLRGGETSQSLSLSDIFDLRDGIVTPRLKAANPPVRATVLYLSKEFSEPLSQAVKDIFLPYFDGVIWFQNTSLYHFSMFHASHHITPVIATDNEIEAEASAVKAVAEFICPLKITLDRVVLTSTGVLLGCWQEMKSFDQLEFFHKLVARVNNKIHGFQAMVSELWFVEEYDVLALALNGRMKVRKFHLGCSGS